MEPAFIAQDEGAVDEDSRNRRFERVVMPHADAAYNLARWLVHGHQDAEDVMQDAMLRAYRYLDSCREDTARQWLLRIVRNTCLDWKGAKAQAPMIGLADLDPEDEDGTYLTGDAFTDAAATPEQCLEIRETVHLVDEIIRQLPCEYREVVVLREMEDLSYKEIAEITGLPMGTVMSRLSRARGVIAAEWKRRSGHHGL